MCLSSSSSSGLIRPCVSPASSSVSLPSFVLATTSEQSGHKNDKDNADWPSWPTEGAEVGPSGRRWTRRRGRAIPKVDRDRTHRRPVCTHSGDFIWFGGPITVRVRVNRSRRYLKLLCYESALCIGDGCEGCGVDATGKLISWRAVVLPIYLPMVLSGRVKFCPCNVIG